MLIGYARVSTADQNFALQRRTFTDAGCAKTFTEHVYGAAADRPALLAAVQSVHAGDTVVVASSSPRALGATADRRGGRFRRKWRGVPGPDRGD